MPASNKFTPVSGQPDIFVFINVADERSLSDVVIMRIHAIDSVEETDTHIVAGNLTPIVHSNRLSTLAG